MTEAEVKELVGNASGIAVTDRAEKIAVASVPFYEDEEVEDVSNEAEGIKKSTLIALIACLAALFIIVTVVVILLWRRSRKKRALEEQLEEEGLLQDVSEQQEEKNREILEMQNDKGLELKRNVRDFAEEKSGNISPVIEELAEWRWSRWRVVHCSRNRKRQRSSWHLAQKRHLNYIL